MKKNRIFIFLIIICTSLFANAGSLSNNSLEMQGINQTLDFKIDNPVNLNILGSQLELYKRIDFNSIIKPDSSHNEITVMNLDNLIISVNDNKTKFLIFNTEYLTHESYNDNMLNIELIAGFTRDKPHINYQF